MAIFAASQARTEADIQYHLSAAANAAYEAIGIEKKVPVHDVHKLAVCDVASGLMVKALLDGDIPARKEIKVVDGVGQHSIVAVNTPDAEIIADPTWQQFLPPHLRDIKKPAVLIGPREEVIRHARSHGVREDVVRVWQAPDTIVDLRDYEQRDRDAEQAFEEFDLIAGAVFTAPIITGAVIAGEAAKHSDTQPPLQDVA